MNSDQCENCAYFYYDDEYECYVCDMDLDEDEMMHFISGDRQGCPYYRDGDEYKVVIKQN
ncbi:MAG: hypothetical protein IKO27_04375 [Ruminococcus sp.]|nr:hypothetical protein [Ruminococcus sp.]